ncbi:MAG: tRNA lysidine(34) synthetase TilS [Sphingobacteriaceae bacterium]|nr:tRNA lysidine(34) synthetase TilS [Sphingobacteriaceae bacterium]
MLPLHRFISFIEQNNLFAADEKVLLAVSGGKDSVLMAHLFNEAKFSFGIAHCNFGLRADESDEDENFTRRLAEQFKVEFYHIRFETETYAKANQLSIQMAARKLRYDWFETIRKENNYDYIALAHHQSDTTETVLLNLVRGTGIAGLHGILPKRGKLIRPLLFLKRDEIDPIVNQNQFPFREDSSNSLAKYARNKLRLEVIPRLKELNPFLENTFESNTRRFKELEDFLNLQTSALREEIFENLPSGNIQISLEKLKALQPRKLLLYELFRLYNFSESVLEDLADSWEGQPGKIFESGTHRLLLDRNALILSQIAAGTISPKLINPDEVLVRWGKFQFRIEDTDAARLQAGISNNTAFFDKALLHFPLILRQWDTGDYFYPFGMKGKKKLSDFFTGLKIPLTLKSNIPVLVNGNGDILWVAGYRSDERYKVTPQTKKVIIFEKQNTHEY